MTLTHWTAVDRYLADLFAAPDAALAAVLAANAAASAANPKFAPQLPRVRLRTSGSKRH